jgi:hypothetical protein
MDVSVNAMDVSLNSDWYPIPRCNHLPNCIHQYLAPALEMGEWVNSRLLVNTEPASICIVYAYAYV